MTQYVIDGGRPLIGTVLTGGSKNALLPILAATILYGGPCEIHRAPHLKDVDSLLVPARNNLKKAREEKELAEKNYATAKATSGATEKTLDDIFRMMFNCL